MKSEERAAIAETRTLSQAIKTMKEHGEIWQPLFVRRGISLEVVSMTPADILAAAHTFIKVPTTAGVMIGTGRGMKAVTLWSVETLYRVLVLSAKLDTLNIPAEAQAEQASRLEKAAEALAEVERLAEEKKAKRAATKEAEQTKKAAENLESTATMEELEAATGTRAEISQELRETTVQLPEAKSEAAEALAAVKLDKKAEETTEALAEVRATA
jgi:hypothetical protein